MEITIKLSDANPEEGMKLMSVLSILQGTSPEQRGIKAGEAIADFLKRDAKVRAAREAMFDQGFAGIKEFFEEHVKTVPTVDPAIGCIEESEKVEEDNEVVIAIDLADVLESAPPTVPEIQEDFVEGPAKHSEYDETIDMALEFLGGGIVKKIITTAGHVDNHGIMLPPKDPYPAISVQLRIIADLKRKMEAATAPEEPAKEEPAKEEVIKLQPRPEVKRMTDKQWFDFCVDFGERHKAALIPIAKEAGYITSDNKAKHIKTAPAELREKIWELCVEHEAATMNGE
jgi:hypothetical protein